MKKIVALVVALPLFLVTASCASSPNWSGAETEVGAFVWAPSPGPRFYVNVVLLGGLVAYFSYGIIQSIRHREKEGRQGIGCLAFVVLFFAFLLYVNVRDFIWPETYTISEDGISHSYYRSVWKTGKTTNRLDWADVGFVYYSPNSILEHHEPTTITDPLSGDRYRRIGSSESGTRARLISFSDKAYLSEPYKEGRDIRLILEKEHFGGFPPIDWIFGSDDFKASPGEEARLKAGIIRFTPGPLKAKLSPETKAYLTGQPAT
jgi:hypothetical protein